MKQVNHRPIATFFRCFNVFVSGRIESKRFNINIRTPCIDTSYCSALYPSFRNTAQSHLSFLQFLHPKTFAVFARDENYPSAMMFSYSLTFLDKIIKSSLYLACLEALR